MLQFFIMASVQICYYISMFVLTNYVPQACHSYHFCLLNFSYLHRSRIKFQVENENDLSKRFAGILVYDLARFTAILLKLAEVIWCEADWQVAYNSNTNIWTIRLALAVLNLNEDEFWKIIWKSRSEKFHEVNHFLFTSLLYSNFTRQNSVIQDSLRIQWKSSEESHIYLGKTWSCDWHRMFLFVFVCNRPLWIPFFL